MSFIDTIPIRAMRETTYLRERTIVPDVSVVREAVPDETQLATLDVLLDGIEGLFLRYLHLRIRPARDLNYHVQDASALVSEEGNVVERRDDAAILLDVNAVFCGKSVGLYCGTETSVDTHRGCWQRPQCAGCILLGQM